MSLLFQRLNSHKKPWILTSWMLEVEISLDLGDLEKIPPLYWWENWDSQKQSDLYNSYLHRVGNGEGKMDVRRGSKDRLGPKSMSWSSWVWTKICISSHCLCAWWCECPTEVRHLALCHWVTHTHGSEVREAEIGSRGRWSSCRPGYHFMWTRWVSIQVTTCASNKRAAAFLPPSKSPVRISPVAHCNLQEGNCVKCSSF